MTLLECVKEYQYDVSINYFDSEEDGVFKWYWDINGGYCSVGARHGYDTPEEAHAELLEFLKTFEPFEK